MTSLVEIEDRLFRARRLTAGAAVLVAATILGLAWKLSDAGWIFDAEGGSRQLDFLWLWTAGDMALRGSAIEAYDYAAFSAAQEAVVGSLGPNQHYYHWIYPPILFFVVAPFSLLPYLPAFFVWGAATTGLYAAAIWNILRRPAAILLALPPGVVVENFYLGHTGALTAAVMGFALLRMERQPFLGGLMLSVLAYKPQFGLLFPIVFAVAGCWRIIAGAALGTLALIALSAVAFGPQAWSAFARSFSIHDPRTLMPDPDMEATLQTVFGVLGRTPLGLGSLWAAQICVAAGIAVLVCIVWRRPLPYELKAAALATGALLATPYLLAYDLVALGVPAAFLIRLGLAKGFLPGERIGLLSCFFLSLHFVAPVGPFVLAGLMALILRRAFHSTVSHPSP